jgi:SAM-dependent methyltransferase
MFGWMRVSDNHNVASPTYAELYGSNYFASHCGPFPYDRSHPHWAQFFGRIADELVRLFRPRRVFDAGCAHGFLVEALWDRGVEAWGRDISEFAISQVRPDVRPYCSVGNLVDRIEGRFDLVVCIEVLEHMTEENGSRAIANMAAVADRIVFSSSPDDFAESTHVNVRPAIYWMRLFAVNGFAPAAATGLPSVTAYALVFEKRKFSIEETELAVCAQLVYGRMCMGRLNGEVGRLNGEVSRLNGEDAQLRAHATHLEQQIAERDRAAITLAAAHSQATAEAAHLNGEVAQLRRHVTHLETQIAERDRALNAVVQSKLWRLVSAFQSVARLPATVERGARHGLRRALRTANLRASERSRRSSSSPLTETLARQSVARKPGAHGAEKLIRKSGLFDADWYSTHFTDVAVEGVDPFVHFMTKGLQEDLNPNPLFDAKWYRRAYPDVAASGISPLVHFIQWGCAEGRRPSASFSCTWYIDKYPDVRASGENALSHYLRVGKEMGRLPLDPNAEYRAHVLSESQLFALEASELELHARSLVFPVRFLIFIEGDDLGARKQTEKSLEFQVNRNYIIIDTLNISEFDCASSQDYVYFFLWLKTGDELNPRALYEFSNLFNSNTSVDMIYADSDEITPSGRLNPFFKPDWSPDYLEAMDYIGSTACFRASVAMPILSKSISLYDFLLRFTEQTVQIAHVRKVLCHRPQIRNEHVAAGGVESDLRALEGRVQRTGRVVREVTPIVAGLGGYDVKLTLRAHPLITLIILTSGQTIIRNNQCIDLLDTCTSAVAERSTYKNLEVIIVDNGEIEEERRRSLESRGYTVVTCADGLSNISKKVNLGAQAAKGDLILLMNENVEVASPDWIERMLEHFEKPHVGVVGAKLLYPDHTIKSAGIVLRDCVPVDAGRNQPWDALGYFLSTCAVRNFTAVSGDCIMTRADAFREVGGFREVLPQSFNDIDYCLRIGTLGLTVVYSPRTELIQNLPSSDNKGSGVADIEHFDRLWSSSLKRDPLDNLNYVEARPHAGLRLSDR